MAPMKTYTAILTDEDDGQVSAAIPELNIFAAGDSAEEAMDRLRVAVDLYVDYHRENGLEVPAPHTVRLRDVPIAV